MITNLALYNPHISKDENCIINTNLATETMEDYSTYKYFSMDTPILNDPMLTEKVICINIYYIRMQKIAESKGGKLLSTTYTNAKEKYKFECKVGHIFFSFMSSLFPTLTKAGSWCKICFYDNRRFKLEDIVEIAKAKGGKCLTQKIEITHSRNVRVELECKYGHVWEVRASNIIQGSWCSLCVRKEDYEYKDVEIIKKEKIKIVKDNDNKITTLYPKIRETKLIKYKEDKLLEFTNEIKKYGGSLLSIEYNDNRLLYVECKNKHYLSIDQNNLSENYCKYCTASDKPFDEVQDTNIIKKLLSYINEKKGFILTECFYGEHKNLPYKCENNHVWIDTPYNLLKYNHWCKLCVGFISERICHKLAEYLFDKEFEKVKPLWLINNDGNKIYAYFHLYPLLSINPFLFIFALPICKYLPLFDTASFSESKI